MPPLGFLHLSVLLRRISPSVSPCGLTKLNREAFFVKTECRASDSSECRASELPFETRSPRPVSVLLGGGIPPPRFIESRRVWFGFFRPFGHSPPRCHSDIYRGHCGTRRTFPQDQLTIYPPSTRLGLGWAPTNPYWGVWVYTGSSWRSPSHHSVMAYRSRSCRASSERRLEHRASDLYAGSLVSCI